MQMHTFYKIPNAKSHRSNSQYWRKDRNIFVLKINTVCVFSCLSSDKWLFLMKKIIPPDLQSILNSVSLYWMQVKIKVALLWILPKMPNPTLLSTTRHWCSLTMIFKTLLIAYLKGGSFFLLYLTLLHRTHWCCTSLSQSDQLWMVTMVEMAAKWFLWHVHKMACLT